MRRVFIACALFVALLLGFPLIPAVLLRRAP
jgi:hypothetical protein